MKLLWSVLQALVAVVTVWLLLLYAADAVALTLPQILMPAAALGLIVSLFAALDLALIAFVLFVRVVKRHDAKTIQRDRRARQLRRAVLFMCCVGLSLPAFAADPQKPILLIIHSDQCPPCRVFDRVYTIDSDLRTALHRAFDVRELDMGVPSQRLEAAKYGVTDVPTYLVLRNGKPVSTHRGFSPTLEVTAVNRAIADLMDDLQVEWPLPRVDPPKKSEPEARPAPVPIASTSHPGPTIDQVARDGITKLATQSKELRESQQKTQQQVEAISADVRQLRNEVTESNNGLRSQIESGSRESRTQLETISRTLQKSIESTRSSTREELETIIRERFDSAKVSIAPSDISTEISPERTASGDKPGFMKRIFRGLVSTAMTVGLTAAQSEVLVGLGTIGGPAGIAIAAGLALWRARKKKADDTGELKADQVPDAASKPATAAVDEFKIENLPLQHIDYTTCWAEHWRNQHADPATALKELELYVQAWHAVRAGTLLLPGIDNPQSVFDSINRWVNRQVTDHAQKALTSENTNHKVFYAHTWKEATHNIREGTFRLWKPNPPAADAIDDWVAARLTEKLTQTSST